MEVKPLSEIVDKWANVTPTRRTYLEQGIKRSADKWLNNSIAQDDAWKEGVQEAIAKDLRKKGLTEAAKKKYLERGTGPGPGRWAQGIGMAKDEYQRGMAPVIETLRATTLPPRYKKRDPRNLERVKAVVEALIKLKTG